MAICDGNDSVAAACYKSPLIMGYGNGGYYFASDEPALAGKCDEITVLEDGDFAEITPDGAYVYNGELQLVIRQKEPNLAVCADLGLGDYPHYMLK